MTISIVRTLRLKLEKRRFLLHEVPPFLTPPQPTSIVDLRGHKLQVIVKLANIVLTPENQSITSAFGMLKVMKNECIVSSGIYYYDNENIDTCSLAFRCAISEPGYEQYDNDGVRRVYNLENEDPLVQQLGAVHTDSNRAIAFPNIYQHRVSPFQLIDPTKPGHRKIIVFFLVDPSTTILSTSNVPPQQLHWFKEIYDTQLYTQLHNLPNVIQNIILEEYLHYPINIIEAKEHIVLI